MKLASPNDIFVWPCGTTCYRSEYERGHYDQLGMEFVILTPGDHEYEDFSGRHSFRRALAGPGARPRAAASLDSLDTSEREAS